MIKYKFDEDRIFQDIKDYIDSTYDQHYASGRIQTNEFIMSHLDTNEGFKLNVLKYVTRYGKKNGHDRKDLMKAVHYLIFMLCYHDRKFSDENTIPEMVATDPPAPSNFYPYHHEEKLELDPVAQAKEENFPDRKIQNKWTGFGGMNRDFENKDTEPRGVARKEYVSYTVQVDGKNVNLDKIKVHRNISPKLLKDIILEYEEVRIALDHRQIKRIVNISSRLINIVTEGTPDELQPKSKNDMTKSQSNISLKSFLKMAPPWEPYDMHDAGDQAIKDFYTNRTKKV